MATASTLNVILMRMHELDEGIDVVDKQGNVVGSSKIAAKKALTEMAVTRGWKYYFSAFKNVRSYFNSCTFFASKLLCQFHF